MYLLRLKYERISLMQKELENKDYKKLTEQTEEKVLMMKYEKRSVGRNN